MRYELQFSVSSNKHPSKKIWIAIEQYRFLWSAKFAIGRTLFEFPYGCSDFSEVSPCYRVWDLKNKEAIAACQFIPRHK